MATTRPQRTSFDPWSRAEPGHSHATASPAYVTEQGRERVDPWENPSTRHPRANVPPAPAPLRLLKPREPATVIAARRMLMYRKGLLPNDVEKLAGNRKRMALQKHWWQHARRIGPLLAGGFLAALAGSLTDLLPLLLAGYLIALSGLVLGCAALAMGISIFRKPLTHFYWREELPATPQEVAALSEAARQHPELKQIIAGWWSDPAPLRKRDVVMAQDFLEAVRDAA